jgi:hypothetical protein
MAEPPSELGAEKWMVAKLSPAVNVRFKGAPGTVKLAAGVADPPPHAVNKTTKAQKIHCNLFNIIFPIELNLLSDYQAS